MTTMINIEHIVQDAPTGQLSLMMMMDDDDDDDDYDDHYGHHYDDDDDENAVQNALTGRLSLLPTDDLSKAAAMCLPPDYAGEW